FTGRGVPTAAWWKSRASWPGHTKGKNPRGASFNPALEWRLPPEWLDAFPEPYDLEPLSRNGQLVSIHPAGFPIIDVAADTISEPPLVDPLKRWLGWLTAYLCARLIRAVGRDDAVDLLCRQPARVALTQTHVEVTF